MTDSKPTAAAAGPTVRRDANAIAPVIVVLVLLVIVVVALFFILGPLFNSCNGTGSAAGTRDNLYGSATVGFVQLYANVGFSDMSGNIRTAFSGVQTFFQKYGLSLSLGSISGGYSVQPSCSDSTGEPLCMISAWAKSYPSLFNQTIGAQDFTVFVVQNQWPYTTGGNGGSTGLGWVEVYSGSAWGYSAVGSVDTIIAKDGIAGGLGLGDTFTTSYASQCAGSLGTGGPNYALSTTYLCSYELSIMHFSYTYKMTWNYAAYGLSGGLAKGC